MQCRECRKWMQPYLAETLPGKRREDFDRHLSECAHCARELAAKQEIIELLHELPAPTPPADLSVRIKLMADAALSPSAQVTRRPVAAYLKLAGAGAAALLLAMATVVLLGPPGPQRAQPVVAVAPVAHRDATISEQVDTTPPSVVVVERTRPSLSRPSRLRPAPRARVVPDHAAPKSSASVAERLVEENPGGRTASIMPAVVPPPAEHSGPTVVNVLDKAPSARMVQTADERDACVPVILAEAAPRTGPSRGGGPAPTATTGRGAADEAAGTLVGTLVANAVVNRYVREAVIESDATIMLLATSAPASLSDVGFLVREAEDEEANNGW